MKLQFFKVFYLFPLAILIVLLTACAKSSDSAVNACVSESQVTVTGTVSFDRVPHNSSTLALDYANTSKEKLAGVTVEAVCQSSVISTATDDQGHYSLQLPANYDGVYLRVKAAMFKTGSPSWAVSVVDNTRSGALYSMQGSAFNTGIRDSIHDLHAASGWSFITNSYDSIRVAAPFAILNSINKAMQKVLAEQSQVWFPSLKINWSEKNEPVSGDKTLGQITGSFFNGTDIFLLGAENTDTDEYDEHVILHEWGHYFEQVFSRSDNIGGTHTLNDRLDMRVAFSEGFGNAFSAMVMDDPMYIDTSGTGQSTGFRMNIENNQNHLCSNLGWFNECTVHAILYDIYDAHDDADDAITLGFSPIYSLLTEQHKSTDALISIFSFIHELKNTQPAQGLSIDALVGSSNTFMDPVFDEFGSQQNNDAGNANVLPVYTDITAGQTIEALCVVDEFALTNIPGFEFFNDNKLSSYRFLKFVAPITKNYTFVVNKVSGPDANPEIVVFRASKGTRRAASENTINFESLTVSLTAGVIYIVQINDQFVTSGVASVDDVCFSVAVTN